MITKIEAKNADFEVEMIGLVVERLTRKATMNRDMDKVRFHAVVNKLEELKAELQLFDTD
jgi:hypothetical protein